MSRLNSHEDPSGLYGTVVGIIGALLALATAFGVPLTDTQQDAILQLAVVAGPAVTAWLIRRKAYAPSTHEAQVNLARQQ